MRIFVYSENTKDHAVTGSPVSDNIEECVPPLHTHEMTISEYLEQLEETVLSTESPKIGHEPLNYMYFDQWQALMRRLDEDRPVIVLLASDTPRLLVNKVLFLNRWHPTIKMGILARCISDSQMNQLLSHGVFGLFHTGMPQDDFLTSLCMVARGHVFIAAQFQRKMVHGVYEKHLKESVGEELPQDALLGTERVGGSGSHQLDLSSFTETEWRVLQMLAQGKTSGQIAQTLYFSEGHVKNVVSCMLQSTGFRNRRELAIAVRRILDKK